VRNLKQNVIKITYTDGEMVNIVIHAKTTIPWHKRYADFFVRGFKKHGISATVTQSSRRVDKCDIAVLFGPNNWKEIEKVNKPYIQVNRKFIGNDERAAHDIVAIGWDGMNGRATFCVDETTEDRLYRFLRLEEIQAWRTAGKQILICGQADTGRCAQYTNLKTWYAHIESTAKIPTKFRPHPTKGKQNSLEKDLTNVKFAAILNSTVSIDMLLAGVPVVTMDKGDPTYSITGHTLDDIKYPDRLPLLKYLAHSQWHFTEIESGKFWEHIYPKKGTQLYQIFKE